MPNKKPESDQQNVQNRVLLQNNSNNKADITTAIGRTLAQLGDKINAKYFEEWNSYKRDSIATRFANDLARTLSVVLICGWCDIIR